MEKFIQEPRLVAVDFDPFAGPEIVRTIPTTEAQREVFTASVMGHDASCAYNESVSLELSGELDRAALGSALQALVDRHEALRATLDSTGMRMIIAGKAEVALSYSDLSTLPGAEREQQLDEIGRTDMTTAFDLHQGPLFRVHLIRTGAHTHLLRLTGHHAVCDGWSLGIMMAEISELYNAAKSGTPAKLPEASRFSEYSLATIDFAKSPEHQAVERYWMDLYKGTVPRMDLPTDRPRPMEKTYSGHRLDLPLTGEQVAALKEVATRTGASFVTTLLATFEVLLYKLTGDTDLVVGLPAAGQSDMGMKHLVGHCVNLLALRSRMDENGSFQSFLKGRRTGVLDAFDNQKYTFGTLVRKLNIKREPGRIPLVPIVFNVDMNMDDGVSFHALEHRFISNPRAYENFELFLNATGHEGSLILEWSYNTDLFDQATVEGWMQQFTALIARIKANPEASIIDLASDTASVAAPAKIPAEWNGKATDFPQVDIGTLFDQVATQHADRTALELSGNKMTYGELRDRVHGLSSLLVSLGVKPGEPVGLCVERGFDMVVAMLATLRAGGCFVPFDPGYPAERLELMLADTDVRVMLTQGHLADILPKHKGRNILLEETAMDGRGGPMPLLGPESPAYIMYTSGSTGKPKGVVVPHRAIIRLVHDQNFLPFGPDLVFLQLSNISFDASTLELWGALLNGAKLVLQPQQKPTLQEIVQTVKDHGVTTVWFTAGLFNLMVDEHLEDLKGLRHILAGGDVLSVPHVRRALAELGPGVLINGYGPTENTTFTCCHAINSEKDLTPRIPIGTPLHNTTVHILDSGMKPVGVGETGELYTGGAGVALGYWGNPELTAERFVKDPFSNKANAKLYRTGDLVRWLPDGSIDFIGRADGQVKVRGFRIELGEIENAISAIPGVKDRVVVVRDDMPGEKQLVAYVVPSASNDENAQDGLIHKVREHLRGSLPGYMVPTAFMLLPELPLNANGKVDRRALPAPEPRDRTMEVKHVAPRTAREKALAQIWADLLKVDGIGVHDNFFDLGGHSLIGIQLLSRVDEQMGMKLPLNSLFKAPTIAEFAKLLHDGSDTGLKNLALLQPEGDRLPFVCVHGDEANHHFMRYLGKGQPYYAFFHQGEDGSPFEYNTVEEIAQHYVSELLSVQPDGPYLLGGYSFGGLVAYEMARQLADAGHEVPLLALFDTFAPKEHLEVMKAEEKLHEPVKRFFMRWLVKRALAKGHIASPKLRHFYIIDSYNRAIEHYRPGPYAGPVTIFKAEQSQGAEDMGWRKLVTGPLDIHVMPGDHYSLITGEQVQHLVRGLSAVIDRAVSKQAVEAV